MRLKGLHMFLGVRPNKTIKIIKQVIRHFSSGSSHPSIDFHKDFDNINNIP